VGEKKTMDGNTMPPRRISRGFIGEFSMTCWSTTRAVFGVACLVTLSTTGNAAPFPSFQDSIRTTRPGLCTRNDVQKELKFSEGDARNVENALKPAADAYSSGLAKLAGLDALTARNGHQKLVVAVVADADKALSQVLSREQLVRLRQIDLQLRGPEAFADPDVGKDLELTDAQKKKLGDLKAEFERKMSRYERSTRGGAVTKTIPGTDIPQTGQEDLTGTTPLQLRRGYALAAKNVLTPKQLDKWYDLLGKPFPAK
jgi:hypothetical protein